LNAASIHSDVIASAARDSLGGCSGFVRRGLRRDMERMAWRDVLAANKIFAAFVLVKILACALSCILRLNHFLISPSPHLCALDGTALPTAHRPLFAVHSPTSSHLSAARWPPALAAGILDAMTASMPTEPNDNQTTVAELRDLVGRFVAERDWHRFHAPKNLVMALAIEAAELMEHFQWIDVPASRAVGSDAAKLAAVAEELADVLCYAMALANELGIDIAAAMHAKMRKNAQKYPADEFRGRYGIEDAPKRH
jgi:NTP pyrophosphatase (non-canonical NTP hydrolase)